MVEERSPQANQWTYSQSFQYCKYLISLYLLYGKVNSIIDKFNIAHGTNIIFPEIDPVKEFFEWTAVVEYCDFVVSVANTTIHAAGWLNKPTFCFLSRTFDWRWTKPDIYQDSYWYPCVKVGRQNQDGSWENAVNQAQVWLKQYQSDSNLVIKLNEYYVARTTSIVKIWNDSSLDSSDFECASIAAASCYRRC